MFSSIITDLYINLYITSCTQNCLVQNLFTSTIVCHVFASISFININSHYQGYIKVKFQGSIVTENSLSKGTSQVNIQYNHRM